MTVTWNCPFCKGKSVWEAIPIPSKSSPGSCLQMGNSAAATDQKRSNIVSTATTAPSKVKKNGIGSLGVLQYLKTPFSLSRFRSNLPTQSAPEPNTESVSGDNIERRDPIPEVTEVIRVENQSGMKSSIPPIPKTSTKNDWKFEKEENETKPSSDEKGPLNQAIVPPEAVQDSDAKAMEDDKKISKQRVSNEKFCDYFFFLIILAH